MVFNSKKGQSALEFLMTYGWAFLVALVVIGGLAYFGVLDPLSWLPSRCKFGAGEIGCSAYVVDVDADSDSGIPTDNGKITIKLENAVGKTLKIANITAYTDTMERICVDGTGKTSFSPTSEIQIEGSAIGSKNELDDGYSSPGVKGDNNDAYLWVEGKSLIVELNNCEFAREAVQAGKKQKFFVDVKYYAKIDGISFPSTVRGEIFTKTEN